MLSGKSFTQILEQHGVKVIAKGTAIATVIPNIGEYLIDMVNQLSLQLALDKKIVSTMGILVG